MSANTPLPPTAGQTVGPFFGYALPYEGGEELVPPHHPDAVLLHGVVYDGAGQPIPDALVEIWQKDAMGAVPQAHGSLHRDGHSFTGFGRSATDADGHYQFWTIVPGAGAGGGAPFLATIVFARGLLDKLHTRVYLPQHAELNDADPFLASLSEGERATLVASRVGERELRHDFHLQGEHETVFLAFD